MVPTSGMENQVRQENEELRCRNAELSRQVADLETEIRAQFYRRQRHQEAMDQSVIPITVINPDGSIKYVNHAFTEMAMFTAPELVAMSKGLHLYEYCWELARIASHITEESKDIPAV